MTVYIREADKQQNILLYSLLVQALDKGFVPVLILRDRSFSFYRFLQFSKMMRIPFEKTGEMLVATIVNAHHMKQIIRSVSAMDGKTHFAIFVDFCQHYVDRNLPLSLREFLFKRDLEASGVLQHEQPAFFFEVNSLENAELQSLQNHLFYHANICLQPQNRLQPIQKLSLSKRQKRSLDDGSTDFTLFHICEQIIAGLENFPQITTQTRPVLL
ncbi:MAG: hypothetical protein AAF518_02565 [Spirochaetota bacterium]